MKKLRSVLSFLMVLALCLSLVTAAFAAEEEEAAVEEVTEEVAEEAAEEVVIDGAEVTFDNVPEGGSFYRRDKNGKYTIEIGDDEDAIVAAIRRGDVNCKSGNVAYVYENGAGELVSLTFYTSDLEALAKRYGETLHKWIINDDTNDAGWVIPEDSCTEGGVATRTCELCGTVETVPVEPDGHKWSSESGIAQWGEIIVEPTCTEPGLAQDFCTVCGAKGEKTREIDALGHDYVVVIDTYPTCLANSYDGTTYQLTDLTYHFECAVCGEVLAVKGDGKDSYSSFTASLEDMGEAYERISWTIDKRTDEEVCVLTPIEVKRIDSKGELKTVTGVPADAWKITEESYFEVMEAVMEGRENGWHGGYELVYYTRRPTCSTEGEAIYHCSVCGYRATVPVEPLNHGMEWVDFDEVPATFDFGDAVYNVYSANGDTYYELDDTWYTYDETAEEMTQVDEPDDPEPVWTTSSDIARFIGQADDFGALQFVRTRLIDCYWQTEDWYCPICKETMQGYWHTFTVDGEAYHYFELGETRRATSHVYDKDFEVTFGEGRDQKKFAVDLTTQSVLDLFDAFADQLLTPAPGQQPPAPGQQPAKPEVNEKNVSEFKEKLEERAMRGIDGIKDIQMPSCSEDGYFVVECAFATPTDATPTDLEDPHHPDNSNIEFVEAGTKASAQTVDKYMIGKNKDGDYEFQIGTKKQGKPGEESTYSWKATELEGLKVYTIPAYGHVWGSWNTYYTPNQDGNGNRNGYWERVCTLCNAVDSRIAEVAPAPCTELGLTHRYVELSTEPSTCVTPGKTTFICEVCGDTYEAELPLAQHTLVNVAEVPATEEAPGVTAGVKCSVCGEIISGCEVIEPVVENKFAVDLSGAEKTEAGISGTGKIVRTEGNQPVGKQYVYVVVNYERADGSTWAVAGTYSVDPDGTFDIPTITGVSDKLTSVLIVAVDAKVGADWAGHNVAPAAKV